MFGGINPTSLATQAILASATGGGSLALNVAISGLTSQMAQVTLQQVGQTLGIPQPAIDLAQASLSARAGGFDGAANSLREASDLVARAVGGGYAEAGQIERQAQDIISSWSESALERERNRDGEGVGSSRGGGGKSFLIRLAEVMGRVLDAKMEEMVSLGEQLDQNKADGGSQTGELTAKISALGQEIGMISQAVNNAIKSTGEAASTLARKQG